jgi:hypothetical protein
MGCVEDKYLVDPFEHSLLQLVLRDNAYRQQPPAGEIRLTITDGISIPLTEIW